MAVARLKKGPAVQHPAMAAFGRQKLAAVHHSATVGMQQRRANFGGSRRVKRTTVALFGLLVLAGCGTDTKIPEEPARYLNMAQPGAVLDSQAAAIMFSQYRQNNGLGAVVVDPALTKLAERQSQAMAARNKMDHEA